MQTQRGQHCYLTHGRVRHRWNCYAALAAGLMLSAGISARGGPGTVEVTVKTVTEEVVQGRVIALSLTDGVLLEAAGSNERRIPFDELVRLTTSAPVAARARRGFTLTLANGNVLHGDAAGAAADAVVVETADLGRITVPLEAITAVDTARALQSAYRESVEWLDRAGRLDEDRILLTNGDVLRGFITSIDADGIAIDSTLGDTVVPHRLIVAARLASTRATTPPRPHLVVTFRTSGRLTFTEFDWSGDVVETRLYGTEHIRIEAERIARIDVVGGRWEWLSAHRPISYEHTPMLSLGWDYAANRNVLGEPLTVGGETFAHGVGVHSRSKLTYDLQGAYSEFVTSFGIDDNSGPYADVSVAILIDGQRRFERTHVRRGALMGPIRLDTKRANRIELIVDFGDNGDLQDRFDWVETALIR